jgi:hypothetical protein
MEYKFVQNINKENFNKDFELHKRILEDTNYASAYAIYINCKSALLVKENQTMETVIEHRNSNSNYDNLNHDVNYNNLINNVNEADLNFQVAEKNFLKMHEDRKSRNLPIFLCL